MSSSTVLAGDVALSPSVNGAADPDLIASLSSETSSAVRWSAGRASRLARHLVIQRLRGCHRESLLIGDGSSRYSFGDPSDASLQGEIHVHSPSFYSSVMTGGTIGAAESWLRGEWTTDDLTSVFRVLLRNEDVLGRLQSWTSIAMRCLDRLGHLIRDNSRAGSRRNIIRHYDLGNDFFRLFLDPSMMYSAAWFEDDHMSLEEASWNKIDRVCRSLQLSRDDHVIEIGTGWGGFALHAARNFGCRITTTTISDEQFRYASERIRLAGLADRVTVLKQDYRDLTGQFDKLVSIEMIEAVGDRHLPEYFGACDRLLKPDGAMLIQAITIPEQRFARYRRSVDFIQKYIFPGGFLPSIARMQECAGMATSLRLLQCQDFGMHYAKTLRQWNDRFHAELPTVRAMGFDDVFIRMWRYYLCYCEAAFLERATGVVHAVWGKPECRLDRTR